MKKYISLFILALLASKAVQAADLKPYISEKVSYSSLSGHHLSIGSEGFWKNHGRNFDDKMFGNRLAVGFSVPVDEISGSIRAELEWGYNGKAAGKSSLYGNPSVGMSTEVKTNTFMLNGYYDIKTETAFSPYVGFGFGYGEIDIKSASYGAMPAGYSIRGSFKDNSLVWNIGAGASYAMNDKLSFDVGYRYTGFGWINGDLAYNENGPVSTVTEKGDFSSHEILAGVRYSF